MKTLKEFIMIFMMSLIGTANCFAQSSILKGRIYAAGTYANISHANVQLINSDGLIVTSITTGFDGRYQTDSIEPGAYRLEVSTVEYVKIEMNNIYLQTGKVANMDIVLSPSEMTTNTESENDSEESGTDVLRKDQNENKVGIMDIIGGILKTSLVSGL